MGSSLAGIRGELSHTKRSIVRVAGAVLGMLCLVASLSEAPIVPAESSAIAHAQVGRPPVLAGAPTVLKMPPNSFIIDLADVAKARRILTLTVGNGSEVMVLDAAGGRILATTALRAPNPVGGTAVSVDVMGVKIDQQTNRAFVLTSGPFDAKSAKDNGEPVVFMLDATTGKVLRATTLGVGLATQVWPNSMLIDEHANRVFVGYNSLDSMSVLDATTGKELPSFDFPTDSPNSPGPAEPFGLDTRDGLVLVGAATGLFTVNERTGKILRVMHGTWSVGSGVVDGQRGRVVLAEEFHNETLDLTTGRPVHSFNAYYNLNVALTLDATWGRALLFQPPNTQVAGAGGPSYLSVVDDTTGREAVKHIKLSLGSSAAAQAKAVAVINPLTGHALVATVDDPVNGGPTHVAVVDIGKGKVLRDIALQGINRYGDVPRIAVDSPTRHVFLTNPIDNTITMYDGTKL